jgi:hypothetical protein
LYGDRSGCDFMIGERWTDTGISARRLMLAYWPGLPM